MEKEMEGKKIINVGLDDGEEDADDADSNSGFSENANSHSENNSANAVGKKNKKITKAVKDILTNNTTNFMSNFDPEMSNREKRKLTRKFIAEVKKNGAVSDETGALNSLEKDVCDCLTENCPGCHFPCPKCRSRKCGVDCRVNRKWSYEVVENTAEMSVTKNTSIPPG